MRKTRLGGTMLKNLGVASFIVGALMIGLTALSFLGMEDDTERLKDFRIEFAQAKKDHENNRLGLLWALAFEGEHGRKPTELDRKDPFATSRDRELAEQIHATNAEIFSLERRQERLHRRFLVYLGVGLFLCVVQAPFLVFAGRQS
jgi:hypothetical protein